MQQKQKYDVLYARKSSDSEDRQVLSIESQIDEMKKVIIGMGIDPESVDVRQESCTAKVPGRPVWGDLIKDIQAGKVRRLFAWQANRLSRNSVDTGYMIYLIDLGKLEEVVTQSQTFRNLPNDKLMLTFFCTIAKFENDNKGVDVKRGLEKKAKLGWLPSGAKPGYANDPQEEKGNKKIKVDPVLFPIIKEAWQLLLTGNYAPPQILKIINEDFGYRSPKKTKIGGRPMGRSQIYTMFRDPFYYGLFEFPVGSGNWFQGKHKPMITEEEFWKAQELLGRKGRPQPQKHKFAFTGMMRCGVCGATITADNRTKRQKNGTEHHYIHYHCTRNKKGVRCTQGVIQVGELEAQIIQKLDELEIPEEFHEFGLKWMEHENKKQAENTGNILSKLQKDYAECLATVDGLIDMRARKELDEQDYKRRMDGALKDKARINGLMRDLDGRVDGWVETANDAFHFVEYAKEKFKKGTPEKKREILSTLGSNRTLKDKILTVDTENALLPMKAVAQEVKAIHKKVRTAKKPMNKKEIERLYTQSPAMLRGWDSNPRPSR